MKGLFKVIFGAMLFLLLVGCLFPSEKREGEEDSSIPVSPTENVENFEEDKEILVGDLEWDAAFKFPWRSGSLYYVVDYDEGIAVKYTRRGSKVLGGVDIGTAIGNLNSRLDITFFNKDGEEKHRYFVYENADSSNCNTVIEVKSDGEKYDIDGMEYSVVGAESTAGYVKNYIIPKELFEKDVEEEDKETDVSP